MNYLLLFVALCTFTECYQIKVDTPINIEVTKFVWKYLKKSPLTIISGEKVIDHFITRINLSKRLITDIYNFDKLLCRDEDFIFVEKNLVSFFETLSIFNKSSVWQSKSKFLIIIQNETNTNNLTGVFQKLWMYKIYNAVVTLNQKKFFTWFPYARENDCGKRINLKLVKNKDPFDEKIPRKLNNCDFNFISPLAPFAIYYDAETKKGILTNYINTLGEKMGLKVNFVTLHNFIRDFERTANLKMTVYDLETYNVESAVYGAYSDIRIPGYQCEYTRTIYQATLYLICPPRQVIVPNLLLLFPLKVYGYYSFSILIIILTWKFIWKLKLGDSIMNTYRLMITIQTLRWDTKDVRKNCILIIMLWYFFHFSVFYQTKLSSLLTYPMLTPKITNVEQFLDANYKIYLVPAVDLMIQPRGPETVAKIREKSIPVSGGAESLQLFLEEPKHAANVVSQVLSIIKDVQDMEIVYDDPLVQINTNFILKKNHPLLYKMNYWILAIQEAGLFYKWVYDNSINQKKYEAKYDLKPKKYQKLSFQGLQSCFVFLIVGLLTSGTVFSVEMIIGRKRITINGNESTNDAKETTVL